MGSCISSSSTTNTTIATTTKSSTSCAIVISIKGTPTQHTLPITVSKALGVDHLSCFLCSSDSLSYNSPIPKLAVRDLLEKDQIYFVLPKSKYGHVLSGNDMAEMAVMACDALKLSSLKQGTMMPRINVDVDKDFGTASENVISRDKSRSVKRASSWVKYNIRRSFRRTLSKIVEDELYV